MNLKKCHAKKCPGKLGSKEYYAIHLEYELENGDIIPLTLQMPESDYHYMTTETTNKEDQSTDLHKEIFETMAAALSFIHLSGYDCDHVTDNQGRCYICGQPAHLYS